MYRWKQYNEVFSELELAYYYNSVSLVPLQSSPAGLRYGRIGSSLIVTDRVSDRLVRLPMYYQMSEMDIDKVVGEVYSFYSIDISVCHDKLENAKP